VEKSKPTLQTFEELYPVILIEINKRKYKWTLTSLSHIGWEDVAQIILIHVWKKWHLYDQKRPIKPWLSVVIASQIKNLIRNVYGNYSRPCLRCDAAEGESGCKIYKTQCLNCPLYAEWHKRKLPAHNIKIPVSIENHPNETSELQAESPDLSNQVHKIHIKMKELLKPSEYKVYEGLFIKEEDEGVVAKKLGYIANEKDRTGRYKQIQNIRKSIVIKIKKAMSDGIIDLY
jgi:hypothetical protein